MKTETLTTFLDWITDMKFLSYKSSIDGRFSSNENSFYLAGSQERFTNGDVIAMFENKMSDELFIRWRDAITENIEHVKNQSV